MLNRRVPVRRPRGTSATSCARPAPDGEDDRLFWRGLFDFLSEGDGLVVLGADLDAAADLLEEDAFAAGGVPGIELGLEVLLGGGAAGVADGIGYARGCRSVGTGTASSSRSAGTRMNRAVWYFAATLPARVRHGLPPVPRTWGTDGARPLQRPAPGFAESGD